jgi:hypothetical protein
VPTKQERKKDEFAIPHAVIEDYEGDYLLINESFLADIIEFYTVKQHSSRLSELSIAEDGDLLVKLEPIM